MIAIQKRGRGIAAACLTILFLGTSIVGCGDSTGLPKRYAVKGTVTYKGAPVEKGTISFKPEDATNGRAATGDIENGSYYLTTAIDGDGALPGKYKVTISSREADFSKAEANITGGSMRQDDVAAAYQDAKKLTPAKYEIAETSGLEAEVLAKSNEFNFDLTD